MHDFVSEAKAEKKKEAFAVPEFFFFGKCLLCDFWDVVELIVFFLSETIQRWLNKELGWTSVRLKPSGN